MGLVSLLFSFRGRINRQQYWFGSMGVGFAGIMLFVGVVMISAPLPGSKEAASPLGALMMLPIFLAMTWAGLAIQVKRFHDRNQPGWLVVLPMIPLFGIGQTVFMAALGSQSFEQLVLGLQGHMWLMWLINFGLFINLGCLGGADGPNKYGDPPRTHRSPRAPAPAAPAAKPGSAAPSLFRSSSLAGAAEAIDRAIAQGPMALEPATVPMRTAAAQAAGAPASYGRRASGGGFGQKR